MTLVSERAPAPVPPRQPAQPATETGRPVRRTLTARRAVVLAGCWLLVALLTVGIAASALGGLKENRAQRSGLTAYRQQLSYAAAAARSILTKPKPAAVPAPGSPVGLLQIPHLHLQRVVLEGASSGGTQDGPGHVPGTAGPGQPGNSVVVGRRSAYGAAFARLGDLRQGDAVVVTTTQGQSVYRVSTVRRTGADVAGPSTDDRLTLVTAAGPAPTGGPVLVVTARLQTTAFPATAQGTRSAQTDGRHGDGSAWPTVIIWATLLALVAGLTAFLYSRWLVRSTYLLTTPALVALVVLLTDAVTRLLPAGV